MITVSDDADDAAGQHYCSWLTVTFPTGGIYCRSSQEHRETLAEQGGGGGTRFPQTGKRIHLNGKRRAKAPAWPKGDFYGHQAGISCLPAALANEGELLLEESQEEAKEGEQWREASSLLIIRSFFSSSGKFIKIIVASALCFICFPLLQSQPKTQSLGLHHASEAILNEVTHDVLSSTSSGHFSALIS